MYKDVTLLPNVTNTAEDGQKKKHLRGEVENATSFSPQQNLQFNITLVEGKIQQLE
jgi:hypothetical protein